MTTPTYQPLEQAHIEQQKKLNINSQGSAWTLFLEHFDLAAIYTMFLNPTTHVFLETIGKFFMFPFAAAANVVLAILSIRHAYLEKSTHSILNAVVQTAAALAITVAVIGALAASAVFALVTPIMFTATLGLKALYHVGQTIYQFVAGKLSKDPAIQHAHYESAKKHGISALAGIAATAAVTCVFLLGQIAFAGFGLAVSVVLMGYAAFLGVTAYQTGKKIGESRLVVDEPLQDSTHEMMKGMGYTEKPALTQEHGRMELSGEDPGSDERMVEMLEKDEIVPESMTPRPG